MKKFVLSVIGQDKPGILARISTILFSHGCNIEDVSQTILQTEFASIFVVLNPLERPLETIGTELNSVLGGMGLSAHLRPMSIPAVPEDAPTQPFVITTRGLDKPGTISAVTTGIAALNWGFYWRDLRRRARHRPALPSLPRHDRAGVVRGRLPGLLPPVVRHRPARGALVRHRRR